MSIYTGTDACALARASAFGYRGAKGYAVARRTIAGSILVTRFTVDILLTFLQSSLMTNVDKNTQYKHIDQLPPFNISILFNNEYGFASYQRLLGVKFSTVGDTVSIQDALTEQVISYVASDYTPLLPLTASSLFDSTQTSTRMASREKVPGDLMTAAV